MEYAEFVKLLTGVLFAIAGFFFVRAFASLDRLEHRVHEHEARIVRLETSTSIG